MVTTGRPTLEDVASLAGVAPVTVSRVVNGSEQVREKTRQKVMAAIEQLGYVPNRLAGGLASARSRTITLVVPASYLSTANFLRGVITAATDAGYHVSVGFSGSSRKETERAVREALSRCPEGMIIVGGFLDEPVRQQIAAANIPVVEAWEIPQKPVDMAVGYSITALGHRIGRYLLDRGYVRPFMAWSNNPRAMVLRYAINQVMLDAGLEEPQHADYEFPGTFPDGINAVGRIAEIEPQPDVLLAMSDWVAHGAIFEATRRGWRVPQDLAVVGFGNQSFGEFLSPSLTSVNINGELVGTLSVSLILKRLRGQPVEQPVIDVGAELLVRESS
ncbi:LacI family DNA-binding transcriptional regulator [Tsuneonella sp. HG222]